jgi:2-aminobenzoate-CoA ligase
VKECAVVAAPDEMRGHIVKAFVVLREGAPPADAALGENIRNFVKGLIAPYKYPRAVEFAATLPKTETGKIQRFKLRGGASAK